MVPLIFLAVAAAANIVLDLVFILCFHMGAEGGGPRHGRGGRQDRRVRLYARPGLRERVLHLHRAKSRREPVRTHPEGLPDGPADFGRVLPGGLGVRLPVFPESHAAVHGRGRDGDDPNRRPIPLD